MSSVIQNILLSLAVGFVLMLAGNFITTVYLHRALTHRAMTMVTPLAFVFRVLTWIMTGIRPRQWVAVHRKHHAFTDEAGDPHSPLQLGWKKVQLTNVALYRKAANDPEVLRKYARDLPQTTLDRVFFDHALVGLGIGVALLWIVGLGPWALLAGGLHAVMYLATSGAVNSIGHTFGKRVHDNTATNLIWLSLLTWGEGLHNNHHAAPTSARFALQRGDFDPAWLFIGPAAKLGLISVRHDKPVLAKG